MVTVLENVHNDPTSKPVRGCFHFTYFGKRFKSTIPLVIVEYSELFNLVMVTGQREGKLWILSY